MSRANPKPLFSYAAEDRDGRKWTISLYPEARRPDDMPHTTHTYMGSTVGGANGTGKRR